MPAPSSKAPLSPRPSGCRGHSSRAERKRPYRDDGPKKIPSDLRDKCGACKEDHDIRFCPYPNTDNGQTKYCPVCDNTKHAWFQCTHYDAKDYRQQFKICWIDRRGLPSAVHDVPLHGIFAEKVDMGDDKQPIEVRVQALNNKAGPLTPDFVKRLIPPEDKDEYVQQQLLDGRKLPWDLNRQALHANADRPDKVIEDPATKNMQIEKMLRGTRTAHNNVPKARKLDYFRELHLNNRKEEQTAQQNSDVYRSMESLDLRSSFPKRPRRVLPSRRLPEGKRASNNQEKITCANCGAEGHKFQHCASKCHQCGDGVRTHMDPQCKRGCLCRDTPGHSRHNCDRPSRLCLAENKDSITVIKDCRRHCPYHLCEIKDVIAHAECVDNHRHCPQCRGRHWHQDCPGLLETICPVQSCRAFNCELHCKSCGGPTARQLQSLCPAEWWVDKETLEM